MLKHSEAVLILLGSLAVLAIAGTLMLYSPTPQEAFERPHEEASAATTKDDGAVLVRSNFSDDHESSGIHLSSSVLRFTSVPGNGKELPTILSEEDWRLYREAFRHIEEGDWRTMQKQLGNVQNTLLVGHLMGEKYLHPQYVSRFEEIQHWMRRYKDHPQSKRLHHLAQQKRPSSGIKKIAYHPKPYLHGYGDTNGLSAPIQRHHAYMLNWGERHKARAAWRQIQALIQKGAVTLAKEKLEKPSTLRLLHRLEEDLARWSIAHGYFIFGKDKEALEEAKKAAARSGPRLPGVYWTAGLAAWRMGKIEDAATYFTRQTKIGDQSRWDLSQAAYWSYRAHQRLKQPAEARQYLRIAARYPRTFYGILARKKLKQPLEVDDKPFEVNQEKFALLLNIPAVQRALALKEIGKDDLAEREIRNLFLHISDDLAESLLTTAYLLDLPAVQIRMARKMLDRKQTTRLYDFARYPRPNWQPLDGYRVDPALVFALTRQESGFNPHAKSYAGARGLMQIMPSTARYVAENEAIDLESIDRLYDPEVNMTLGQAYIAYLMEKEAIDYNLFFLAAAYNAGPGNLRKWINNIDHQGDPLLFLESIPIRETQNYVEQVITNYWMYKALSGEPYPSLDELVSGEWPRYDAMTQFAEVR